MGVGVDRAWVSSVIEVIYDTPVTVYSCLLKGKKEEGL